MAFEIGPYQVGDRLYQGRDLSVYRAIRLSDGLQLIAKIPNTNRPESTVSERLNNEFRILQRLPHAGHCRRVLATEPYGASVALFFMYADGASLAEHISQRALPLDEFLRLAILMTEAVAEVHDAEIVHKDICPNNFIVSGATGDVTLIDFDRASMIPRESVEIRSPGALEGTLAYMSPEQTGRMNRTVDYRTDLYSLGATFYEMLTGTPPFVADHRLSLIHQLIARAPDALRSARPALPTVIEDIVLRLLAKAPELRYQSAVGVLADLKSCRDALRPDGSIAGFAIAQSDVPNRFQIPERLYGREAELETILETFRRTVVDRTPMLLLVSGEPGVGKSSLVSEVHKPIVASTGYFIGGKFDQLKRNVPFASLIEALRDLLRQVLTESDSQLRQHRVRIQQALGPVGQLVVDAIPELERLIGPQQPVPELPPLESQNRFRQAFRAFLEAFAQPEHPLCLLLDDVQWADSATLAWIEATMFDRSLGPLLLICAYRDNEVSESHPFALAVDRMRRGEVPIDTVFLAPLQPPTTRLIVADTLVRDGALVDELTAVVQQKTHGNPFFINQLLRALHLDGAIRYSSSAGAWTCDLEAVRAAEITENVVEFLTRRLRVLPGASQEILQMAACVGNTFDLDMLATASGRSTALLGAGLAESLDQGLIDCIGNPSGGLRVRYRFQHDRVQQAAYRLMDAEQAKQVRLRIGRRLLADCRTPETDDRLFDILQHLNFAHTLVTDHDERLELARLNLAAAVRAKRSTAYVPAMEFVSTGMEVLPSDVSSRLAFDLTLERAECEHLTSNDEAAETFFARALQLASDDFERAEVYERKIQFYTNQALFDRAFATGLEAAGMLGIWLPAKFFPPLLIWDHLRILRRIGGRSPMELFDLPELRDERMRRAIRFMADVSKAAYQIRPELCISICARIVILSLRYGYTEDTAIGFLAYGVIFRGGVLGNHKVGDEFGQLVLSLVDRFNNQRIRAEVTFVYGYFANSWIRGLANSEEIFTRAYQAGIDSGDQFHASCACSGIVQNMLMRGAELESVNAMLVRFEEFLRRVNTTDNIGTMQAVRQTIRNLRGQTIRVDSFSDEGFDEAPFVASLSGYGSPHFAHFYFVDKLLSLLLWGRYDDALDVSRASARLLKDSPGMQHAAEHHFLNGLLRARLGDRTAGLRRRGHRRAVHRAARAHRKWAADSPSTYQHKQYLLEAELRRLDGDTEQAAQLYDQAIEAAEKAGYQHVQALAHELAGQLHLKCGANRTARYHLTEAAQGYHRWGAHGLAADIRRRYEWLLGGLVFDEGGPADHRRTSDHGQQSLDLETVLKASQAISGEVQLSELFRQLMTIVRQNAGAERAALLLARDGQFLVQAEISEQGEVQVLQAVALDDYAGLARSVVNFVVRSGEALILADASAEVRFYNDPHVARTHARSVMCVPLYYLGELSGVLYVENNLAVGAFTEERIEILKLLSGQIGVSIANAELYEKLEEKVRLRTAQLETRNRFISQTFGRYLSDEIVEVLLEASEESTLGGEKRLVTLIFSDLRGFTTISEALHPEDVVSLINIYLGVMTEVFTTHQATIIDFIGDAIIAVFGAPMSRGDDVARAVACAIDMQRAMERVNELNVAAGYPPIGMGIGLNTGEVIVGSIGSEKRAKYTVLGSHVNLAARIESYAVQGDVLISPSTRTAAGPLLEIGAEVRVEPKGVNEPITISYVRRVGGKYNVHLPAYDSELTPLVTPRKVHYVIVDGKKVGEQEIEASLVALSERRRICEVKRLTP
jgi:predicted ATPase/class 3 adenylate cyclase